MSAFVLRKKDGKETNMQASILLMSTMPFWWLASGRTCMSLSSKTGAAVHKFGLATQEKQNKK
jgi:hypothetical protein